MYVVYITFYAGNKLPPFYIGKTDEAKVLKGYNGTVTSKKYKAIWQQERRDNPHLFKTEILSHHETDEDALLREEALHRFYDVPNNPSFINMAISRKGFGGAGVDSSRFENPHKEESIQKMRESKKGKKRAPFKRRPPTEVTRQKMRLSAKSRPPRSPQVIKKMSERMKGEGNPNFGKHHNEEARRKMRLSAKSRPPVRHWQVF